MKTREHETESYHRTSRRIEQQVSIRAPVENAWAAWTNPEGISSWFTDSAEGECREGQTVIWNFDDFGYRFPYRVLKSDHCRRLVLESSLEGGPAGVIDVQFEYADGITTLRLVNSGFLDAGGWDDEFEGIDSGWQMALATLRYYLETAPAGQKRSHILCHPTRVRLGLQKPYFVEGDRLRRWLGQVRPDHLARGSFSLECGGQLEGRVEVVTRDEVLLSLKQPVSLLGLKAFVQGGATQLAIHFVSWSEDGEAFFREHRDQFQGALEKLSALLETPDRG